MTLGERIYKLRESLQLSQKEFAEKIGVSQSSIFYWESGKKEPKLSQLEKIADALQIPVTDLLYDETGNTNESIQKTLLNQIKEIYEEHPDNPKPFLLKALEDSIYITKKTIEERQAESEEKLILDQYNKLNSAGKQKAVEYTTDLAQMPKYQRDPDAKK